MCPHPTTIHQKHLADQKFRAHAFTPLSPFCPLIFKLKIAEICGLSTISFSRVSSHWFRACTRSYSNRSLTKLTSFRFLLCNMHWRILVSSFSASIHKEWCFKINFLETWALKISSRLFITSHIHTYKTWKHQHIDHLTFSSKGYQNTYLSKSRR